MRIQNLPGAAVCCALLGLALIATEASAASLSYQTLNPTGAANVTTGPGTVNVESTPGSDNYGNTYIAPSGFNQLIGAPTTNGGFGFYDDYIFQITAATVNSVTSTITLGASSGISNLQVRLFALPGGPYNPISPGVPVTNAWSTAISASPNLLTYSVLNNTSLAAGTYVLQVRGKVTGTSNGSYSGVLNIAPIPVPAAVWLFGSALGLLGLSRRRLG